MTQNAENPSFLQRAIYAWNVVKASGILGAFGTLTVFGLLEKLFKLRDWLSKIGLDGDKAYLIFITLWAFVGLMAIRVVFNIAAVAGADRVKHEEAIAAASIREGSALATVESLRDVFSCLHAVIHRTRDSLLFDGAFLRLIDMTDGELRTHLHQTIEAQLGMMEKSFRHLTHEDCHVVLKIKDKEALNGAGGLVSCCYSPSTPIERRTAGTVLPLNQGIAQEAVITKQICYTNNVLEDARFWPQSTKHALAANRYQTVVACPVITNGVVLGVLCFDWRKPAMYEERYHNIFACFTDIVSAACYICYETRVVAKKNTAQAAEIIKNG